MGMYAGEENNKFIGNEQVQLVGCELLKVDG